MKLYVGREPKVVHLGIRPVKIGEPVMNELYPTVECGVLSVRKGRIATFPLTYRELKRAQKRGLGVLALAAVGVSHFRDHILLGLRSKRVNEGGKVGVVPAGHVSFGEKPKESVLRELKEEVGAEGEAEFLALMKGKHYIALIYEIELEKGDIRPNWEWEEIFWVRKNRLSEFIARHMKEEWNVAPLVAYMEKEGDDWKFLRKMGMDFEFEDVKDLRFRLRALHNL